MSRFNVKDKRTQQTAAIATAATPSGVTAQGGTGFDRDAKSELYLLAATNFFNQETFYEAGGKRDERYAALIRQVAVADPDWMKRFIWHLRDDLNMRTASIVGAVEAAEAMVAAKIPGARNIVFASISRADEPGETLAYAKNVIGRVSKPVKRGIGDAARGLYTQRNTLKYDTDSKEFRFGDVLELCHVKPRDLEQTVLFKHLIDRRHNRTEATPDVLTMLIANEALRKQTVASPEVLLNAARLSMAGMNWEDVKSLAGSRLSNKDMWEALIPNMGYMALLRNLRNFDQAGVSNLVASQVADKLKNPDEVARSRQLPMRFLSAYRAAPSDRWKWPLDQAITLSLGNIPQFPGRTLILVDTSGSMNDTFSKDGTLKRWDAAVMFGLALASRCDDATVVSFSNASKVFPRVAGESLLKGVDRWKAGGFFYGGGTDTERAVSSNYSGHDRVIVLTDEQAAHYYGNNVYRAIPFNKLVVTFNLAGYAKGSAPSGSQFRVTLGGLTDAAFKLLPMLEARSEDLWPF